MPGRGQYARGKVSQTDNQHYNGKRFPLRSVLLIVLIVGLGAAATTYALSNVFAANNGTLQQSPTTSTSGQQLFGLGIRDPQAWSGSRDSTYLSFRSVSTATNVTVTGFNIVDSTHITLNLAYHGSGIAPALTVVALAPGLSGSNTLSSGWGSSTTISVALTGTGSLSTTAHVRVLVVPLTGA